MPVLPGRGGSPDCFPGTIFSGSLFIQDNANLDYCLLQITSGDPASMFGYLEIDDRAAVVDEEIYIIGHPGGKCVLRQMPYYRCQQGPRFDCSSHSHE